MTRRTRTGEAGEEEPMRDEDEEIYRERKMVLHAERYLYVMLT